MADIKCRYKRFKEWEKQPHEVAPLSKDEHVCATCGTRFEGNYCPRCGQSAKIGRYSFKKAFLLFLDVWGMGNRGMFRTLRDLILRPGYMIRDYLRGMQMAYFPPFKLFFLLITLTVLIDAGLNIKGINRYANQAEKDQKLGELLINKFSNADDKAEGHAKKAESEDGKKLSAEKEEEPSLVRKEYYRITKNIDEWSANHSSITDLLDLLFFTLPLWLLFRHCPAIPDLRLSECFVAMVYITNMLTIYELIPSFFCFSPMAEVTFSMLVMLLAIIPIKQLSGYGYGTTVLRVVLALFPFMVILFLLEVVKVVTVMGYAAIKYG